MNLLLPLSALGAYILLKPSTKSSSSSSLSLIPKKPCLSDDCQWLCSDSITAEGLDFSKQLYLNQKLFNKHINKHINDPDFGINSLTKELLKTWKRGKCKSIKDEISIEDTLTLRYAYVSELPTAAFYLALSEKITDLQLAMWLGIEYPKLLNQLGLLIPGEFKLAELQSRFDFITPKILTSIISKAYILNPELRNIQAELLATILMIQFSQIVQIEAKEKCIKIVNLQYGDFSSLSGKIDPAYQLLFKKIYDAVIIANQK